MNEPLSHVVVVDEGSELNKVLHGPIRGRSGIVPEKVQVKRKSGIGMETRYVQMNPQQTAPKEQAAAPLPTVGHDAAIQDWQNKQVSLVSTWAQGKGIENTPIIQQTIASIRGMTTPEQVHDFLAKQKGNKHGIQLADYTVKDHTATPAADKGGDGWQYLGKVQQEDGSHKYQWKHPKSGTKFRSGPPENHPDYEEYQARQDETLQRERPYFFHYNRELGLNLNLYPPKDTDPGTIEEHTDPDTLDAGWVLKWQDPNTGKTQFGYTKLNRAIARSSKFAHLYEEFIPALPKLREEITSGVLDAQPGSQDHAIATILGLVDHSFFRIGADPDMEHRGLCTLRKENVSLFSDEVQFNFVGKDGVDWIRSIDDPKLVNAVKFYAHKAHGENDFLFTYNNDGVPTRVDVDHVAHWMYRKAGNVRVSPKDFRTYHATMLMKEELANLAKEPMPENRTERRRYVRKQFSGALARVADLMGHTPKVCKSDYIDPTVILDFDDQMGGDNDLMKSMSAYTETGEKAFAEYLAHLSEKYYGGDVKSHLKKLVGESHGGEAAVYKTTGRED